MGKLDEVIQVNLRLTRRLHGRLERSAERRNGSLNGEMVLRLEASFEHEDLKPVLVAIIDRQKRMGGVLADAFRDRLAARRADEEIDDIVEQWAELVRDYFGRPDGAAR